MSTQSSSPSWPSPRTVTWHRPLLWLALAMAAVTLVGVVGLLVDPRTLTGAPLWAKPLKFAVSILIYSLTLSWLLGLLRRGRRLAWWAGTITAVFLTVEMIVIVGAAAAGVTSHFNVTTPFHAALWSVMAVSIVIVWAIALLVAVLLFRADLGDPARSLAIRAGALVAVAGMGLAFLMTGPTAAQRDSFQGIAGAHTVGVPDGGPGLPLLGWSTVAGDLRIPHFVGMHALQAIPLAALLLELLARRIPALAEPRTRFRLIWVVIGLYLGVLALLTGQALAGQSIVRPDVVVVVSAVSLMVAASIVAGVVLWAGHRTQARSSGTAFAR
ncbi:hypothetical protein RCH16_001146 [Cryobacterium sp. MP_M5]|uniref:hypothetical protein n=1 Tax=unclassified Cryobacterium TaxID=2649013 RepID=UPI0018CB3532|nr:MULTISPECIES: hypothetical protein [unclassified Cryobacterium]MBG6057948.1 hypothetical protein [Cryobacterium sp. MP_M3]MEC5176147.1 hypothetical protein [Cryobacterium sp. MP_M5]